MFKQRYIKAAFNNQLLSTKRIIPNFSFMQSKHTYNWMTIFKFGIKLGKYTSKGNKICVVL